jgi:hypothetical protein
MTRPIESQEARLEHMQRGWHRVPAEKRKFQALEAKLKRAGKNNGERQVKMAAALHVLAKFALLDEGGDPIVELTRIIKDDDFGYTKRTAENKPQMKNEKPVWGPPAGLGAGWTADQLGAIRNESYGGV